MAAHHTTEEQANLDLVAAVYREVLCPLDGDAVERYFRDDYIQHNPMAETGAQGLARFLRWARATSPGATHEVKRMFADGDHVIAHVHVVVEPGTAGNAVVDIFRIQDGLVAEHWDAAQPIAETAANSNGVF